MPHSRTKTETNNSDAVIHFELEKPCFPFEKDSPIKPERISPVTLRSVLVDRLLSVYVFALISRLDSEGRRVDDCRIEPITYNYHATDHATEADIETVRAEICKVLSLAGHEGVWKSGAENIRTILDHYAGVEILNRIEFERLISDAETFLGRAEVTCTPMNISNKGIVIQGQNACTLSDTEWEILSRIFYSARKAVTISELCDSKLGMPLWDINRCPENPQLLHWAKRINNKLAGAGISFQVGFRDGVFRFESR